MQRLKGSGGEGSDTRALARKEYARLLRRQAYEREKARRSKDPKFIAKKEAMKAERRALYQQSKEKRKAVRAELKAKERAKREEVRAAADESLMKMLRYATKGSSATN